MSAKMELSKLRPVNVKEYCAKINWLVKVGAYTYQEGLEARSLLAKTKKRKLLNDQKTK